MGWQDHFAAPTVTLKGAQHVPAQQLLGQEILDPPVIGCRMFKKHQMTGVRNNLQSRALEQVGNLAHGGMSTCILFAANEKHRDRRCLDRVWIMSHRTEQWQKRHIHASVEFRHLFEKKAQLRLSNMESILVQS